MKKLRIFFACLALTLAVCVPYGVMHAKASDDVLVAGNVVSSDVEGLNLQNAVIADLNTFILELAQCPNLNYVDLCNSNLSNEQMEVLQNTFPQIKFVWMLHVKRWSLRTDTIAFSTLQWSFPEIALENDDIEIFKYCKDLVGLDVGHNRITDISVLRNCPNLRVLILSSNNWLTDITPVADLPNLMYLEIFCTRVSDLTPLAFCENIVDLNVSVIFSGVNSIDPLLHFPKLERLWFTRSGISDADRMRLQATYPNVAMNWTTTYSIDAGWRTHPRYYQYRAMWTNNSVEGEFATTINDYNVYLMRQYKDLIFDASYYLQMNPEVANVAGTDPEALFNHYMVYGIWEGKIASPNFSIESFINSHPGSLDTYGDYMPRYLGAYILEVLAAQTM